MKQNLLNSIKLSRPKKSLFDLSHDVKLSMNMGELIPVMVMDVVPTDKVRISHEALIRLQPMVAPMMHRCDVSLHTFFVPNRILWPNWESWITNQKIVGGELPAHPTLQIGFDGQQVEVGDLADYMGLPLTNATPNTTTVSALPFAAYQMVYNEYYRDQNQIPEVPFDLVDGDNTANTDLLVKRQRAWEHDYFTAAAPEAQAGDPVTIPLAGFANVPVLVNNPGGTTLEGVPLDVAVEAGVDPNMAPDTLYASTSEIEAVSTTINDLRTAYRLQEWLEKSMRGGRRLFENILVFFGLKSPDSRLQRPEYITGSKSPINISEVLNTTGTDDAPQGTMAGHGLSVVNPKSGDYFVQEHGYIITIMSVLPRTAYQQGIHKHFLKYRDPMQIYWPQFDHLGEQAIENQELYAYQTTDGETFGYIPRYAEYKFMNSRVAGDFRDTLNFWHMGRIFTDPPALNADFVEAYPTHRVFAVTDPTEQKLLCHVYNSVTAIRPMSKYSTPTF